MSNKSFIIYIDLLSSLDELNDAQAGKLFKAIKAYHMSRSEGEGQDCKAEFDSLMNDFVTRLAFAPFRASFERDAEKYQRIVERNRTNGLNGGRKKDKTQTNPNNPVGFLETQRNPKEPKQTHNDNVNDNDSKEILTDVSTKKGDDEASPTSAHYRNFMQWMKDNAPNVYAGCGKNLTETEYTKIREATSKEKLVDCVLAIENRKDLLKKYRSLYLTLRNWIKRDEK